MAYFKLNYLVTIILIIFSLTAGFYIGSNPKLYRAKVAAKIPLAPNSTLKVSPILKNQTATVVGILSKVSPTSLTITDGENITDEFPIAKNAVVYKPTKSKSVASASSDITSAETDKSKVVTLQIIDGQYQVITIADVPNLSLPTSQSKN